MKSRITELLGIKYPIFQGGMAWVAEYHLAAAVSEAGGLGLIGAASALPEWVREQIREVKKLTDKPFGVNIMLMSPNADEVAKIIVEEGVPVVTTGAGNPEKYMQIWKSAGVKVIPVVASVAMAKRMERCGADGDCGRRDRSRRSYRREYDDGSGASDCRCGFDSGHRSRRNRGWKRNCRSVSAGGKSSSDGNTFCSDKRVSGA